MAELRKTKAQRDAEFEAKFAPPPEVVLTPRSARKAEMKRMKDNRKRRLAAAHKKVRVCACVRA
jgi:hypothetical protein